MQNTDLLIVCLRKRGHKSLRLHTILFPSVCYFIVIVWMITIINIEKKSVQGIISFHEYIIIMNIGQSILITERVSFFFSSSIFPNKFFNTFHFGCTFELIYAPGKKYQSCLCLNRWTL